MLSSSFTNQGLYLLSSIVCITLVWEVRWWRWSFSFWGWSQRGWWVRRNAAQLAHRECRSMLEAGNGWQWSQRCWPCWRSGCGSDHPAREGARWGHGDTDRQLAWQRDRPPVPGVGECGKFQQIWVERGQTERRIQCVGVHTNVWGVCVRVCEVRRLKPVQTNKQTKQKKYIQKHRQTNNSRAKTEKDEWRTRSGRLKDGRVDEREVNWRDRWVEGEGVSEKKDMAVSQHTRLSRSLCVVSSERETFTQSLYTWKGEMFKCHFVLLSLPLARYTPQHRVLIYKNKTKRQYESFEPQWHSSFSRVRVKRAGIFYSSPKRLELAFACINKRLEINKQSTQVVPALHRLNLHGLYEI